MRPGLTLALAFAAGVAGLVALPLLGLAVHAATNGAAPTRVTDSKVELFVHDVEASIAFYAVLGFEVAARKPADDYTTLRNGDIVVALSPLPRWLPVHWLGFLRYPPLGTELVFYTDDLEHGRASFLARGLDPGEITLRPWGHRDFRITDPDGYYVRVSVGEAVPESGADPAP